MFKYAIRNNKIINFGKNLKVFVYMCARCGVHNGKFSEWRYTRDELCALGANEFGSVRNELKWMMRKNVGTKRGVVYKVAKIKRTVNRNIQKISLLLIQGFKSFTTV